MNERGNWVTELRRTAVTQNKMAGTRRTYFSVIGGSSEICSLFCAITSTGKSIFFDREMLISDGKSKKSLSLGAFHNVNIVASLK